jgi:hypothetical protein
VILQVEGEADLGAQDGDGTRCEGCADSMRRSHDKILFQETLGKSQ